MASEYYDVDGLLVRRSGPGGLMQAYRGSGAWEPWNDPRRWGEEGRRLDEAAAQQEMAEVDRGVSAAPAPSPAGAQPPAASTPR